MRSTLGDKTGRFFAKTQRKEVASSRWIKRHPNRVKPHLVKAGPRLADRSSRKMHFEAVEPRVLLSADLAPVTNPLDQQLTLTLPPADQSQYQTLDTNQNPIIDMAQNDPALLPLGSLIHTGPVSGSFDTANETDQYTVTVDQGQTLTIGILPKDASIRSEISVTDPLGNTTTLDAVNPGDALAIQNLQTGDGGMFTINFRNLEGTGNYDAAYWLNAQLETENYPGGAANNDISTAININNSSVHIAGSTVDRLAVVGTADGSTPDYYSFSLNQGQTTTIAVSSTDSNTPGGSLSLELYDANGNLVTTGRNSWKNIQQGIWDFVPPAAGTYYAKVSGNASLEYSLVVIRGADFDLEPNSQPSQAQGLLTPNVLGDLSGGGGAINVAVVSSGSGSYYDSGLQAIVNQLNDDTYFDFNATLIAPSQADTLQELQAYDAVVIGGTGYSSSQFNSFAPALVSYVEAGGGLVTTGWGIYASGELSGQVRSDFDSIVPVNTSGGYYYSYTNTVTLTGTNPIVSNVGNFTAGPYIEYPSYGIDSGAETLATIGSTPVAAAKNAGSGRSVYLGPLYAGGSGYDTSALRTGNADRLMEQAVAWAANTKDKVDQYQIQVNTNDQLIITTTTPGDGANEPANTLDPKLELYAPDGTLVASDDNGASDGRNASINYTAAQTGAYRIVVSTVSGTGDYILSVQGATGAQTSTLSVASSSIADQTKYNMYNDLPTSLDLTFSTLLNQASLDTSKITINGNAVDPSSITVLDDAKTLRFDLSSVVTGDGSYNVVLADGAITSLQDAGNASYSMNFYVDQTPPEITGTWDTFGNPVTQYERLGSGDLQLTLSFSESLDESALNYYSNEAVSLTNEFTGETIYPTNVYYYFDPAGGPDRSINLRLTFASPADAPYTMNLNLDAFYDTFGNPLSAGSSGGYSLAFYVDSDTVAFPTPLNAETPAGSLIYDGEIQGGMFEYDSGSVQLDVDRYNIQLDANQRIAVAVTPIDSGLWARVDLLDPQLNWIAGSDASGPGQIAFLNNIAINDAGTYQIVVSNQPDTTTSGRFRLGIQLNAAGEEESLGVRTDDDMGSAQDINASAIDLGNGMQRGAVRGELPSGVFTNTLASENFDNGQGPDWALTQSSPNSEMYFDEGALYMYTGGSQQELNEAVWTVDLSGASNASSVMLQFQEMGYSASAQLFNGPFQGSYNADGIAISADGTNWYPVFNAPNETGYTSWNSYEVDLLAAVHNIQANYDPSFQLGANFQIKFQQYSGVEDWAERYWDNVNIVANIVQSQQDWYSFNLNAHEPATIVLKSDDPAQGDNIRLELYNSSGNIVAAGVTAGSDADQLISFMPTASGTYYARIMSTMAGEYSLVYTQNADFGLKGLTGPQAISMSGPIRVAVLDPFLDPTQGTADQLNDSTRYNFQATVVQPEDIDTLEKLNQYDVVVLGYENGNDQLASIASVLRQWVEAGGGVIGTGGLVGIAGVDSGNPLADIDAIIPVDTSDASGNAGNLTLDIAGGNSVTAGIANFFSDYTEYAAADPDATVLGTADGQPAVAVKQVGQGRGVYLGLYYMQGLYGGELRDGNADQLLEQAVAWAAQDTVKTGAVLSNLASSESTDTYAVKAKAGDTLTIYTETPYDGTGEPSNSLDPVITLYGYTPQFSDQFDSGVSGEWGNEVGDWIADNGTYRAQNPSNNPSTYSSLPYDLTNFTLDVDVNNLQDGGIWLRASGPDGETPRNGVLLITGGGWTGGTGLYWHTVTNGSYSGGLAQVNNLFDPGVSNAHLHIVVAGDTYQVYVNGSDTPATTLVTDQFASGRVGLYDNSDVQTFDNVVLKTGALLASSDNDAADGRNAWMQYTVNDSGTYTVQVNAVNGAGDYILHVEGSSASAASNFNVTGSSFPDYTVSKDLPTSITLDFSSSVDLTSLSVDDINIFYGRPGVGYLDFIAHPNGFTVVDGNTITFDISGLDHGDGTYHIDIPSGSVQDLAGNPLSDFGISYLKDTVPIQVSTISLAPDSVVPTGNLDDVVITFSRHDGQPVQLATAGLGTEDVVLTNVTTGETFAPSFLSYDPNTASLALSFAGLTEGQYRLTLLSASDGFRDILGNLLDGDGNGTAGGNYNLTFYTDKGDSAFPTPLTPMLPNGSLIYDPVASGYFYGTGDNDAYTVDIEAGQTLTIRLNPQSPRLSGQAGTVCSGRPLRSVLPKLPASA